VSDGLEQGRAGQGRVALNVERVSVGVLHIVSLCVVLCCPVLPCCCVIAAVVRFQFVFVLLCLLYHCACVCVCVCLSVSFWFGFTISGRRSERYRARCPR